jgi:hypothetical protein
MRLIATWTQHQDAGEMPTSVKWEDGTPATLDDYERHQLDTRSFHPIDDGGRECHMWPDIVADVTFDATVQDWVMRGQDVNPAALDVKNPKAPDCEIYAALITFPPVVYKVRIIRS